MTILVLTLLSVFMLLPILSEAAPGPNRENIVTQPVFEHKVDSCTINHYYVGRTTVMVCNTDQSFRFRIIQNNPDNTKRIYISTLLDMTTWQRTWPGASWMLKPGDYWYENSYFGPWYALNEDLSVSSSTIDFIEIKKVIQ